MTLTIKGHDFKGKTAESIAKRLFGRKAVLTVGYRSTYGGFDFKIRVAGVTVARGIGRGAYIKERVS